LVVEAVVDEADPPSELDGVVVEAGGFVLEELDLESVE
jgi:hypothetical protein